MKLLTDLGPLRSNPVFRRLWISTTLSQAGGPVTAYAVTLQVWDTTHSTVATGAIGVVTLVPMLLIALPGGSIADTVDRRKLVLLMTACSAVVSGALFLQELAGLGWLWLVYALVATSSAIGAVNAPTRRTLIRSIVTPDQLPAAVALNRVSFQTMLIGGSALAGVVTGAAGLKGCYLADTVSFVGSLYGVFRMPAVPAAPAARSGRSQLALTGEGLVYIWRNRVLAGAFFSDMNATFFALPVSLFPAINAARFGGDPRTLGLFTSAIGAGGMVTAVLSRPFAKVTRQGIGMLAAVAVWGLAFAIFAVAPSLWLTLLALGIAGAADSITVMFRGIIVQRVTPPELLGRVNAADYLVGAGGGQLGSLESGLVGAVTSAEVSALAGGLLTVAGALAIVTGIPAFRRYRDEDVTAPPSAAKVHSPA
ncbi:MAG: MFS transporter [Streptosporangiaceae bacterium]|nr:MFS transporter [Streptosporangiaceae bacterium]